MNFTSELILEELPHILPSRILVVELLEDVQPTEEVLSACKRLKERGYIIALDDFIYTEGYDPLIQRADIIKVDFLNSGEGYIRHLAKKIRNTPGKVLLGKKITRTELARSLGFTLFGLLLLQAHYRQNQPRGRHEAEQATAAQEYCGSRD